MTRLHLVLILTAGAIVGCATPLTGNYDLVVFETENGCSDDFDDVEPPSGLQGVIIDSGDGTMTLVGEPDEICSLDDEFFFTCEFAASDSSVQASPRQDALVFIDLGMVGAWSAPDAFEAIMSVDLTCTGEDCPALEAAGGADCAIEWKLTAERD